MLCVDELVPTDLRDIAHMATEFLGDYSDLEWTKPAGTLEWTCRETLEHVIDGLDVYAVLLATRAQWFAPAVRIARDESIPIKGLLRTIRAKAAVLSEVVAAAPEDARACHPRGVADPSGFLAMGINEVLVHTSDIADGSTRLFRGADDVVHRLLRRLFPWAPRGGDAWTTLLWANDRTELPTEGRIGEDWTWWCRPLVEWDGKVKSRTDTGG